MRVSIARLTLALTITLAGAAFAATAGAIPGNCNPGNCPDPDPDPGPPADGTFASFSATAQACEPRLTPWNTLSWSAPGSTRTVVSVSPEYDGNYAVLQTFTTDSYITFRHQSHGVYRVQSFKPTTHLVDTRYWTTC